MFIFGFFFAGMKICLGKVIYKKLRTRIFKKKKFERGEMGSGRGGNKHVSRKREYISIESVRETEHVSTESME